ncbi:MAG: sulfurtransferase TusA family protein [Egibacteraceae bacterium]
MEVGRLVDLTNAEQDCGDSALTVVRRALKELDLGQIMEVRTTVAEHAFVVRAWARKTGKSIISDRTEGKQTQIFLERTADG